MDGVFLSDDAVKTCVLVVSSWLAGAWLKTMMVKLG